MNSRHIASIVFAATLLAGAAVPLRGAQASVVYSQDFNNVGFEGSSLGLPGSELTSDKYASTSYYNINNFDGWSFTGGAYYALGSVPGGGTDGAVLLNENGGTATTVIGLMANQTYLLTFNYWGDNRPGQSWVLNVNANGSTVDSIAGVDGAAGSNPLGTTVSIPVTSDGSGNIDLLFWQASPSQASPIFDSVQISSTPLPATLPLFMSSLGLLGLLGWLRSARSAQQLCSK